MSFSISKLFAFFKDDEKSIKRGENHYNSNHVLSCSYSHGQITGKVQASMKKTVYSVMIELEDSIRSTSCECPRGLYKCSHAAALYIFSINNIGPTDLECKWMRSKETKEISSVHDLFPTSEYRALSLKVDDAKKNEFLKDIAAVADFAGINWIVSPEPAIQCSDPSTSVPVISECVETVYRDHIDHKGASESFLEICRVSPEVIQHVVNETVDQAECKFWFKVRKNRLTASTFGEVIKRKKVINDSLIKKLLTGVDLSGVKAIEWGRIHEVDAVKQFENLHGVAVQKTGCWLHHSGLLAATPDGLLGEDCVLEVKCPYSARNMSISEAISNIKDFYLIFGPNGYELKKTHHYWHQIQGQMYITGRQKCIFLIYTLKDLAVIYINRDEDWEDNISYLENFYLNHIFKKLYKDFSSASKEIDGISVVSDLCDPLLSEVTLTITC